MSDDALALAFRTGLPYVGLRDHEHDPELDRCVPPQAARAARVVLLTADDDHLRLAVTDPEPDLSILTPYIADRDVQIAIASRDELDAVLGPATSEFVPPPPVGLVEETEIVTEPEPEPAEAEAVEPEPPGLGPVGPWASAAAGQAPREEGAGVEEPSPEPEPFREPEAVAPSETAREPEAVAEPETAREPEAVAESEAVGAPVGAVGPEGAEVLPWPAGRGVVAAEGVEGEAPSWLEPPRTARRVLLTLLSLLLIAVVVAGAVVAYIVLTR